MIIGAVVIVGYTVMGGFMAVSTTDLIQSVVMSISLVVIVFYGIHMAGGWSQVVDNATSLAGYLSMTQMHDRSTAAATPYGLLTTVSTLAWGLGYFGMPHILVRFMSIEKPSMVKKSATVAIIWVVCALGCTCLIAYFGRMFLAEELLTVGAQKMVFITFARQLFPSFIAGVLMAAIIAASMSTADSSCW